MSQLTGSSLLRKRAILVRVAATIQREFDDEYEKATFEERWRLSRERSRLEKAASSGALIGQGDRFAVRSRLFRLEFECEHELELISVFREKLWQEVRRYIEPFAMEACRSICDDIQHLLPRELRDMIYGYLLVQQTCHEIQKDYTETANPKMTPFRRAGSPSENAISWPHDPHTVDIEYVGRSFKAELGETWYHSCNFVLDDCSYLQNFLQFDLWSFGLIPRDHIRCLLLQAPDFTNGTLSMDPFITRLKALHNFKTATKMTISLASPVSIICFLAPRGHEIGLRFAERVGSIVPALGVLMAAGYVLRIKLSDEVEFELNDANLTAEYMAEQLAKAYDLGC
jgi:hypothetical protein